MLVYAHGLFCNINSIKLSYIFGYSNNLGIAKSQIDIQEKGKSIN